MPYKLARADGEIICPFQPLPPLPIPGPHLSPSWGQKGGPRPREGSWGSLLELPAGSPPTRAPASPVGFWEASSSSSSSPSPSVQLKDSSGCCREAWPCSPCRGSPKGLYRGSSIPALRPGPLRRRGGLPVSSLPTVGAAHRPPAQEAGGTRGRGDRCHGQRSRAPPSPGRPRRSPGSGRPLPAPCVGSL